MTKWVFVNMVIDLPRELSEAERAMRGVDEQVAHIQSATFNVVQRGQDLLQVCFDSLRLFSKERSREFGKL